MVQREQAKLQMRRASSVKSVAKTITMKRPFVPVYTCVLLAAIGSVAAAQPMQPSISSPIPQTRTIARSTPLFTSWGAEVTSENVHAEYPRPTFVRSEWLNLNGYWDWKDEREKEFKHQILVPFPVESILSGITRHTERCVYRRSFSIPHDWAEDDHVLLHFGAVDWEAAVFVNGRQVGTHRGGYTPFSFDITSFVHRNEPNELLVQVFDPSQKGEQPRGKQSGTPSGVWYTASTGIWQTVWLEPVSPFHFKTIHIQADYDTGHVTILPIVSAAHRDLTVIAEAFDGEETIEKVYGGTNGPLLMQIATSDIKPWSPDSPHLYQIRVQLLHGDTPVDRVGSYFAFRKIEVVRGRGGYPMVYLNNKPLFLMGIVDQGYWSDGLYTAPSDRANLMDIRVAKAMGFNVIRKYQKIEPERWYFWCDRMGILVWQDMPSGDFRSSAAQQQFQSELQQMILTRSQHPSIMAWTIFNEGAGQHNAAGYLDLVRRLDKTRLVTVASGWTDTGLGDFNVSHRFPGPEIPPQDVNRVAVIGLFGGLALTPPMEHRWSEETWGYQRVSDSDSLVRRYGQMHEELRRLTRARGLAGAFFHQLTDVESECNGFLTYDRLMLKVPTGLLDQINRETIRIGSE